MGHGVSKDWNDDVRRVTRRGRLATEVMVWWSCRRHTSRKERRRRQFGSDRPVVNTRCWDQGATDGRRSRWSWVRTSNKCVINRNANFDWTGVNVDLRERFMEEDSGQESGCTESILANGGWDVTKLRRASIVRGVASFRQCVRVCVVCGPVWRRRPKSCDAQPHHWPV